MLPEFSIKKLKEDGAVTMVESLVIEPLFLTFLGFPHEKNVKITNKTKTAFLFMLFNYSLKLLTLCLDG